MVRRREGDPTAYRIIDLETWNRAGQFRFFRDFDRPHYALTVRQDVSAVVAAKARGVSPFHACLYAAGAGMEAVPELRTRFDGDVVTQYDRAYVSVAAPTQAGSFDYAQLPWQPDFAAFDTGCKRILDAIAHSTDLDLWVDPEQAVLYATCMPWLDYTAMTNAMPGPLDCIPRVSWGKIVQKEESWDMAMTLEVHHALVDGAHVGAYFAAVQAALDGF